MDPKKVLKSYYDRLFFEAILKASLTGLVAGLFVLFAVAITGWFFGFGGFWLLIVGFVVGAVAVGLLAYFKVFRPSTRAIACRLDELGLEERIITMTELEGDPSYIAMRQREDAMKVLSTVKSEMLKIALSIPLVVCLVVASVCGLGGTTVYSLYSAGVMGSGMEIINKANEQGPALYSVQYKAEKNGKILGLTEQKVYEGEDALAVMAIPNPGFIFIGWSDGYTDAYRVDYAVAGKIEVTALFDESYNHDPDHDKEPSPEPDDLPPAPGDPQPNPESGLGEGDGGDGKWNASDQYLDGETDYGDDLGDATNNANEGINNGGGEDSGVIGDYFSGIQK